MRTTIENYVKRDGVQMFRKPWGRGVYSGGCSTMIDQEIKDLMISDQEWNSMIQNQMRLV